VAFEERGIGFRLLALASGLPAYGRRFAILGMNLAARLPHLLQ